MEVISITDLAIMSGTKVNANMTSLKVALDKFAGRYGLNHEHRLAQFLPQILHESGRFRYDTEVWGPTPAQKRYEDRKDLGNSPAVDGEAEKFKGRTALQATGRANYRKYTAWCRAQGYDSPDFEANPELINTDPWEGLFPIYFWDRGNPTGKSLNNYADENNIEQITKRINGGLNGYDDRLAMYTRVALVLAGFSPTDIKGFQAAAQKKGLLPADTKDKQYVDGDAGPVTRSALHMWLVAADSVSAVVDATPAPVVTEVTTEVTVPTPVVAKGSDKAGITRVAGAVAVVAPAVSAYAGFDLTSKLIIGGIGLVAIVVLIWRGELIAARVKKVIAEFGS